MKVGKINKNNKNPFIFLVTYWNFIIKIWWFEISFVWNITNLGHFCDERWSLCIFVEMIILRSKFGKNSPIKEKLPSVFGLFYPTQKNIVLALFILISWWILQMLVCRVMPKGPEHSRNKCPLQKKWSKHRGRISTPPPSCFVVIPGAI
jgi:hypothetical protein